MSRHELNPEEQAALDTLLERFVFTPIVIRLTATMLDKSIIDARESIQAYLARTGIVEFGAVGQGPDHKIQIPLGVVVDRKVERRTASFYRPATKQGDPRLWISGLGSIATAGDALILAFTHDTFVAFVLPANGPSLLSALSTVLPGRFEERGDLEREVSRLAAHLAPLSQQWVTTMRSGPTGVGFTLESILGRAANSSPLPDFPGVELKAYRRGAETGQGKLVTLLSNVPTWCDVADAKALVEQHGYRDEKKNRTALYCTITTRRNSLGWRLALNPSQRRVNVQRDDLIACWYSFDLLERRLEEKHPATLYVQATARGAGAAEEFRYDGVILCREPSMATLLELVADGEVGLDFTLHLKANGKTRDHGYLWRIREHSIPRLYAYRRNITSLARSSGSS